MAIESHEVVWDPIRDEEWGAPKQARIDTDFDEDPTGFKVTGLTQDVRNRLSELEFGFHPNGSLVQEIPITGENVYVRH